MISLYDNTISEEDIQKLIEWLGQKPTPRLSKGPLTIKFEEEFAKFIGTKYALFCNSGSSANLLMLYALIIANKLKNKKIIVPSLSWATDLSPVINFNLEPILCDINLDNLSVDLNHLEEIFKNENPACLLLVSILGFSPDMDKIKELCEKYSVILISDCCETLGTKYNGKILGNCDELMTSYSFYASHIMCTIEGGMITTNDEEIYDILLMLRSHGWGRDLSKEKADKLKNKWNISDFNNQYTFYIPAFNLRSTDLQAFIGLEQLKRVNTFIENRNRNFEYYQKYLINDYWKPKPLENSWTSNFCYPVIHPKKNEIVEALIKNDIECRPLVSGSHSTQPFYIERYGVIELSNSKIVDDYGFYVPNNPSLSEKEIKFVCEIINKIIND